MAIELSEFGWQQAFAAITAVGAFGVAAVGITDAFSKFIAFNLSRFQFGLPYMGFRHIRNVIKPLSAALKFSYGPHYMRILAQQYRDGRSTGRGPVTIQQGVRLAMPYMEPEDLTVLVGEFWGVNSKLAKQMSIALTERGSQSTTGVDEESIQDEKDAVALIGRFSVALDSRIDAAYKIAEQSYKSWMQLTAGITAIVLALAFNQHVVDSSDNHYPWFIAFLIGTVAVPLAPVAKDLSSSLSQALKAWQSIGSKKA